MKHFSNNGKEYLKKDDNWDENDYQGRSKDQYKSSAIGATISIGGFLLLIMSMFLYRLIIFLF
jgi:hypothetical protein|tara:strand:- start:29 stop:217 length:189 start_codon:yes stop_codon:yes gene_type:complete